MLSARFKSGEGRDLKTRWKMGGYATIVLVAVTCVVFYVSRPSKIASALLNVDTLPKSVESVECRSALMQDTVTVCAFDINPTDAKRLISARPYLASIEHSAVTSHERVWNLKVGQRFDVATTYTYSTDQGEAGYRYVDVDLMFNAEQSKVLIAFFGLI